MSMILALDMATVTGWCAGAGGEPPALGHIRMPDTKEEVGPFLDFFYRWLHLKVTDLQSELGPAVEMDPTPYGAKLRNPKDLIMVFEAPVLPRAKIDPDPTKHGRLIQAPVSVATTRKLQGLAGVAEMVAFQRGLLCEEVYAATVKKHLGGSGRADKPDMMAAAERCGLKPKRHDEADAFGVWICAVRAYAREHQQFWDQRLYGPRSML